MPEEMVGDNRPPVYWHETIPGMLVIRASALGHPCMWELIASGQGIEPGAVPEWMRRAFREGHDAEPLIVADLEANYGFVFQAHQTEGELKLSDNIMVRYHPDGVGLIDLEQIPQLQLVGRVRAITEIKNLSHELWWKAVKSGVESTIADYPVQASVMMVDLGLPLMWACRNKGYPPDKETGIKPPCPDEGKMWFQWVTEPFWSRTEMRRKAILIKEGVEGEDLLTVDRACDAPNHFPCRYLAVRPEPETAEGPSGGRGVLVVHGDAGAKVDDLVARFVRHKGDAYEAGQRADAVRDELLELGYELSGEESLTLIETDRWHVPVRDSHSTKYNWDKMPAELRLQVEEYKTTRKTGQHVRDIKRKD